MSITLHAAIQARRLLAFTAAGLPSATESHPMDHDSDSSGHANIMSDPITFVGEPVPSIVQFCRIRLSGLGGTEAFNNDLT